MSKLLTVEETVWARWGRRAVTVPLYLLLGTVTVTLLPATITLALASDAARRTGHLVTLRCTLAITLYFTCEALGIVASFVLWVAARLWPGPGLIACWRGTCSYSAYGHARFSPARPGSSACAWK